MNFDFINPNALWALPLSLLPLLLHLLFRRPPQVVLFGDIRFLKKIYERYRPRKKLKERVLLLLRILTLLFLFLFFARPTFNWGGKLGSEDTLALVILLDASYSMRGQEAGLSNWDRAVRLAQNALQSLKKTDRSAVIVFSDKVEFASGHFTNEHNDLSRRLNELKPSYRKTDFLPPLQAAYQLLVGAGYSNKAILVLSDLAKHGWGLDPPSAERSLVKSMVPLIKNFDPQVKIICADLPLFKNNIAIEDVRLMSDLYLGQMRVEVDLKNWGTEKESDVPVFFKLHFQGDLSLSLPQARRQGESAVSLQAGEEKTVTLTAPLLENKTYLGEAGIRKDSLMCDDVFFITQPSPEKIKVLCVEEPSGIAALSGESYFLNQALVSPPSLFEAHTVSLTQMKKTALDLYHALALVNPGELDDETVRLLSGYVKKGGALFLTLGERSAINQLKSIEGFLPCGLGEIRQTMEIPLTLPSVSANEEIGLFKSEYDWEKIKVNKIVQPLLKENADPWILLSDGTPLLLFSEDQKIAVWMSTIDRGWNNLPSKPVFAPLTRFILKKISVQGSPAAVSQLKVGDSFKKTFVQGAEQRSVSLTSPSGAPVLFGLSQGELISAALEEPGFYSLADGSGEKKVLEKFSVNVDAQGAEGHCERLSPAEFRLIFPGSSISAVSGGKQFQQELTAALRGKELSRLFLVFAGLFLFGEFFLSSRNEQ